MMYYGHRHGTVDVNVNMLYFENIKIKNLKIDLGPYGQNQWQIRILHTK